MNVFSAVSEGKVFLTQIRKEIHLNNGPQIKCVNTVSLRLCLEYCQSCQFDQLVALYFETNTFNLKI